jgi:FAD/FMN-containing dehydrogenase
MSNLQQFLTELRNILPTHTISTEDSEKETFGRDWLRDFSPSPSVILTPENTEQIQAAVALCAKHSMSIVPSGGRTGLSGGAAATNGEVVISLQRMRHILGLNPVDRTIQCQAGVVVEQLQLHAKEHGLYFPVDFSSRGSAHVGGIIGTNAGGIRVIRYGNTREWVVGLKVVTAHGELLELNGSLFKNNTGYDLRSLFIGSEGTLGIIVEATLRLTTPPRDVIRMLCGLNAHEDILPFLTFVRSQSRDLSAFEFMERAAVEEVFKYRDIRDPLSAPFPTYVLAEIELHGEEQGEEALQLCADALEEGLIADAVVSNSTAQADELLGIRDFISETLSRNYSLHKNDISVPVAAIPAFLRELHDTVTTIYPDFKVVVFGHVGDGNLHVNVLKPHDMLDEVFYGKCHDADHAIFKLVSAYRGSISAEHGVGLLKRDFLHYSRSPLELSIMRGIKRTLDPDGIMNPGKIFCSPLLD